MTVSSTAAIAASSCCFSDAVDDYVRNRCDVCQKPNQGYSFARFEFHDITKAVKCQDSSAEWSKALASGTSPQGRGFEPHSCHFSAALVAPCRTRSLPPAPSTQGALPKAFWLQVGSAAQAGEAAAQHKPGAVACPSKSLTCTNASKTVWPSGLRRWLQAPVRKGVGSNPTAVTFQLHL